MTVAEIEKRADDIACMHGLQEDRHEIFATLAVAELKRREAEDAAHLAEMNEPTTEDEWRREQDMANYEAERYGGRYGKPGYAR